jgi:tungstate transport system ATP-binding protein
LYRKWSALSGGESQRVALASRLILKPKVLILDEPTTGVDTNSAQLIKEAILSAKQKYNTTIMISSHDHNWLNHICDKRIGLFQGELVENGSVNLLYAPWTKNENGNLVKLFIDGQKLTVPNSEDKKRDAILMINSSDIKICKVDCENQIDENTLKGKITSIHQQEEQRKLLVEFTLAGVGFNCRICRSFFIAQSFLPGDDIYVNFRFSNLQWI